jgi:hypothetical protein
MSSRVVFRQRRWKGGTWVVAKRTIKRRFLGEEIMAHVYIEFKSVVLIHQAASSSHACMHHARIQM